MKTYIGEVKTLETDQYFVFGSNTQGRHGKGSALVAYQRFGALYGQARGFQGKCYAIVTKDISKKPYVSMSEDVIMEQIDELYESAREMDDCEFLVAYSGTGTNLNGYTPEQMARMFKRDDIPENIIFEAAFSQLVEGDFKEENKNPSETIEEWINRIRK